MTTLRSLTGGVVLVDIYGVGTNPVDVPDELAASQNVQESIGRGELEVVVNEAPKVAAPKDDSKKPATSKKAEE